jgi:Pseudouridylate synthases, 23S RNA-specific
MFPILFENKDWIAINKPAGLTVESSNLGFPSVEETVLEYCAKSS